MPSERKKKTPFDLASVVGNIAQALASTSAPAPVSTIGELSVPFGVTFEQGQALRDSMGGRDAAQMQLYQQGQALRAEERAEAARLALDQRRMRQEKKQSKAQIAMQEKQLGLQERGLKLDEKEAETQEEQFNLTMQFNEEQNRLNRELDQQQIDIAKYSAESDAAYKRASLGFQSAQLRLQQQQADPAYRAKMFAEETQMMVGRETALTKAAQAARTPEEKELIRQQIQQGRVASILARFNLERLRNGTAEPMSDTTFNQFMSDAQMLSDPRFVNNSVMQGIADNVFSKAQLSLAKSLITDPDLAKLAEQPSEVIKKQWAEYIEYKVANEAAAAAIPAPTAAPAPAPTTAPSMAYKPSSTVSNDATAAAQQTYKEALSLNKSEDEAMEAGMAAKQAYELVYNPNADINAMPNGLVKTQAIRIRTNLLNEGKAKIIRPGAFGPSVDLRLLEDPTYAPVKQELEEYVQQQRDKAKLDVLKKQIAGEK